MPVVRPPASGSRLRRQLQRRRTRGGRWRRRPMGQAARAAARAAQRPAVVVPGAAIRALVQLHLVSDIRCFFGGCASCTGSLFGSVSVHRAVTMLGSVLFFLLADRLGVWVRVHACQHDTPVRAPSTHSWPPTAGARCAGGSSPPQHSPPPVTSCTAGQGPAAAPARVRRQADQAAGAAPPPPPRLPPQQLQRLQPPAAA